MIAVWTASPAEVHWANPASHMKATAAAHARVGVANYLDKLVLVTWVDSSGTDAVWSSIEAARERSILESQTVGWVVKHTKREICLVASLIYEGGKIDQIAGEMHIPTKCIKEIKALQ